MFLAFVLGVLVTTVVFFAIPPTKILKVHGLVRSKAKALAAKIED